jgi:hypothetical protein
MFAQVTGLLSSLGNVSGNVRAVPALVKPAQAWPLRQGRSSKAPTL